MWSYEKRLQFPVHITHPNAAAAKVIITQYGGPDGELGAKGFRYYVKKGINRYVSGGHRS